MGVGDNRPGLGPDRLPGESARTRSLSGHSRRRPATSGHDAANTDAADRSAGEQQRWRQTGELCADAGREAANISPLRQVYQNAVARWATIDSYIVRLKRREVVAGKMQQEELMLVKFRKEPFSIYFKWLGNQAKGREVIYVQGRNDNQLLTLNGAGDVPLMPASFVLKISPDTGMARARCRYPITDAGFGSTIQRFGNVLERNERGDTSLGTLRYVGQTRRPEYDRPLEEIVQTLAPRSDPLLPDGGERHFFFDTDSHLPLLIFAADNAGREVEYYANDRFEPNVGLDDGDFDPDRLWKKSAKER